MPRKSATLKTAQKCSRGNTKEPLSNIDSVDTSLVAVTDGPDTTDDFAQKYPERDRKKKYRDWCFTLHTSPAEPPQFYADDAKYFIRGREICPSTGKFHWQCFVVWNYQKTFSAVKKLFPKAHLEACRGSPDANIRYCRKEGKYDEFGKAPAQGERGDLLEVKEAIYSGEKTAETVMLENPSLYHQYGRTLDKIEDARLRRRFRTEMTQGIWYWGETGVGKSHKAFSGFTPETHYNVPKDNNWWDGYTQQDTVIINEFRGHIKYDELLELVDKFPKEVSRRGRLPMPFTSKRVIVTSSLPPALVYHNRNSRDSIEQLKRRFKIVQLVKSHDGTIMEILNAGETDDSNNYGFWYYASS